MSHQMLERAPVGLFDYPHALPVEVRHADSRAEAVVDHPVFSLLDCATRGLLLASGRSRTIEIGATLSINGCVNFVQDGLLGTISPVSGICVGVAGAGAVIGLESGFDTPRQGHVVALAQSQVFAAPVAALIEGMGRSRVMELCMRQSLERLNAMEAEAACNAAHLVPHRVAKWLVRLHLANQGGDLHITQAELARLMGVQRTSVNAATRRLQLNGAARFARGLIVITDLDGLTRSSCSCAT